MTRPHPALAAERIARLKARDPAAIDAVIAGEGTVLWRAARAAGLDDADAEDAVQETLLVFVRRAHEFDGSATVRTWLYGILLNKIREHRRSQGRERAMERVEEALDARFDAEGGWTRPPRAPDAAVALSQATDWLRDCLGGLPERYRLAVMLKDGDGYRTSEVCKVLGVTANNLGVILFRARAALRDCLETRGIERASDVTL